MENVFVAEMPFSKPEEVLIRERLLEPKWHVRHEPAIAITIGLATIILMVVFWWLPHVERDLRNNLSGDIDAHIKAKNLDKIPQRMAAVEASLSDIKPLIDELVTEKMRRSAKVGEKEFKSTLPAISGAVSVALRDHIPVPAEAVKAIGEKALKLSTGNQASSKIAWNVVLNLVAYRSTINIRLKPKGPVGPLQPGLWKYRYNPVRGLLVPHLSFFPQAGVPTEQAARFDHIGTNLNKNMHFAPALLLATGGATRLDGMDIENVIFEDVEIHYAGAPLILKNVVFINCKFVIENIPFGRELGQQLLASGTINFDNTA